MFELRGSEVVVTRAENLEHEDPAIAAFLTLLEKDIRAGRHIMVLPDDLANTMLTALERPAGFDEDIVGEVVL